MRNKEGYVQYYEYVVGLISSNNNERRNAQRNATYLPRGHFIRHCHAGTQEVQLHFLY